MKKHTGIAHINLFEDIRHLRICPVCRTKTGDETYFGRDHDLDWGYGKGEVNR